MIKSLLNIIYENKNLCLLCRERYEIIEGHMCRSCYDNLEISHKEISLDSPYISRAYHSIYYNRLAREKMAEYKFQGKNYLYKAFGDLMCATIGKNSIENIDLITYVPSHWKKEALRGYNQSYLLAKYISDKLDIDLSRDNLIKQRKTKDQNKLNKMERLSNLKNSFIIRNEDQIRGKKILLIDDIITTGSTMEECSKVLLGAGAREIIGLALTTSRK